MSTNAIRQISLSELGSLAQASQHNWYEVVVHHFFSPSAAQYKGRATWDAVRDYHINGRGWSDIGYHLGVGPDNSVWILRHSDGGGYKGPLAAQGGHCLGHNTTALGVVLAGNFDVEDPKQNGWDMLAEAVALLCGRWHIPVSKVYPHRQFADKSCPGKRFDMNAFRSAVLGEDVTPTPDPIPAVPQVAVVIGSSYVPCEPRMIDGRMYGLVREIYKSCGWDGAYALTQDGHRFYPKDPAWEKDA